MKRYDDTYETFWRKFKGRWNAEKGLYVKVGKYEGWLEWKRLTVEEKEQALAVASKTGGKYTPDVNRWLKRKLFDDFTVKEQANA